LKFMKWFQTIHAEDCFTQKAQIYAEKTLKTFPKNK